MKNIIAVLLVAASVSVHAQSSLTALNDASQVASLKIRSVTLGSGTPSLAGMNSGQFDNARSLGNGLYQVPGYMPYYPTAATIFPRVVQVRCSADVCDGYTITPALGRGEYVYVQPLK